MSIHDKTARKLTASDEWNFGWADERTDAVSRVLQETYDPLIEAARQEGRELERREIFVECGRLYDRELECDDENYEAGVQDGIMDVSKMIEARGTEKP